MKNTKKKNKVISLTLSTFLALSAFGNVTFAHAEGEDIAASDEITEQMDEEENQTEKTETTEETVEEEKEEEKQEQKETESSELMLTKKNEKAEERNKDGGSAPSWTFNGLTVSTADTEGLTYGTAAGNYDIYSVGNILYINTNKAVTVKGTTTTAALAITKGTHAKVTFDGVSINYAGAQPVNLVPNAAATTDDERTQLYLTLADGSNNRINTTGASYAGIHVSYGAILTIDDSVKNWADVEGGRIVGEKDENGIDKPSWLMDSHNPGSITVLGGQNGACIGGDNNENSGKIIINGGNITVNSYTNGTGSSAGAGIGGGYYGGTGCSLDGGGVTINGGNIDATASYHGAGIGAGWSANTAGVGHNGKIPGDITINGGYIQSTGREHGNAFNGACGSGSNLGHGNGSTGHRVVITGGTLLPSATASGTFAVGGAGSQVIVTGGSFYPTNTANSNKNGSAGITGASVVSSDGTALTMVKIAIGAMEGVEVGDRIYDFTVSIDGKPLAVSYGLANKVANDKTLYFWLPASSIGKSVSISNVTLMKSNGELVKAEYPFSLPEVGTGDGVTKRWVIFGVDTDQFSEQLKGYLYKTYDGLGWDMNLLAKEIVSQDIEIPEPKGEKIDQEDQLDFSSVRVKDWFGNATTDESTSGEISTTGTYKITANYNEFKNNESFSQSFWGHQTTLESIISPASSQITNLKAKSTWQNDEHTKFATITLTADVYPGEGEAKTCAAPDGEVQFYINGVKVGKPVKVKSAREPSEGSEEYAYSSAELTIDFTKDLAKYPIPELSDGTFQIEAQYLGGTNYKLAEKRATVVEETSPEEFPFATPPTPKPGGEEDTPIVPDKYEVEDGEGDTVILHGYADDSITNSVSAESKMMTKEEFIEMFNERYDFINIQSDAHVETELEKFVIKDKDGKEVEEIDISKEAEYTIIATVFDKSNNYKTTLTVEYDLVRVNIDTDGDGKPDVNIDTDKDGKPDINIDPDGDNIPDINIDTDGDGKPDVNIDTDGDKEPDINIVDKDGDGKPDPIDPKDPESDKTPDINIDKDGDGKPDVNVDTDDDGKPDVNIDTDKDGKPDINIDPDGDGKPDINIVDKDGDGKPDDLDKKWPNISDVKPDVNIDKDDDGKPDINIDTDKDGKPDVNIDKDDDGKPDINIDTDEDNKPDVNVDPDGDGKPDVNIDTDGDGKPDINIDKDGDGKPDVNVDTDNDGKPDVNIDKDGDGEPDLNIDPDGDGKPDINIVDKDGDGKPDDLDEKWPNIQDVNPDVNIDTDKDGKTDVNVDVDGDGKPDINIVDKDGDGKPDTNIDPKEDVYPDINIDTDRDGKPDINIDTDGDGKPDINIVDKDGDGKPDTNINPKGEVKPDLNIDVDGDGKADLNIDTDGDGKADLNIDKDGDGKPDLNIDTDGDGIADKNIDKDGDGVIDVDLQGEKVHNNNKKIIKTGDETSIYGLTILTMASLLMGSVLLTYKKKENE